MHGRTAECASGRRIQISRSGMNPKDSLQRSLRSRRSAVSGCSGRTSILVQPVIRRGSRLPAVLSSAAAPGDAGCLGQELAAIWRRCRPSRAVHAVAQRSCRVARRCHVQRYPLRGRTMECAPERRIRISRSGMNPKDSLQRSLRSRRSAVSGCSGRASILVQPVIRRGSRLPAVLSSAAAPQTLDASGGSDGHAALARCCARHLTTA